MTSKSENNILLVISSNTKISNANVVFSNHAIDIIDSNANNDANVFPFTIPGSFCVGSGGAENFAYDPCWIYYSKKKVDCTLFYMYNSLVDYYIRVIYMCNSLVDYYIRVMYMCNSLVDYYIRVMYMCNSLVDYYIRVMYMCNSLVDYYVYV